ncbi:MAG: L-serine ammonia-lyase, iron-sulfur-dependent, subunit alpha [Anaeromicrobium sp.]|nr:L-serine ammonia-lyase, iron-sulfur-dependent, subunit alpha [Anaeromicrobium sp.]MCT4593490.1 L-serine ammonia-lyase, iron-sulfur-dependent, subunit alpha [Anaeromicrobium sp.]
MMNLKDGIIKLLEGEVIPAMGCTEPIAVALACAKAKELLEGEIESAKVLLSPNVYKNGLCVGIPNTEEVGLEIAAALGVVGGKSQKVLNVLAHIESYHIEEAKELLESGKVKIGIKDTNEKVYIGVELKNSKDRVETVISNKHTHFTFIKKNENVILEESNKSEVKREPYTFIYHMKIYDIIKEIEKMDFEDVKFMLDGLNMNKAVAEKGLESELGMKVGRSLAENIKKGILSDDLLNTAMMFTAAASDARMSGINMSVMSSNGSGNNGLTAILPIVAYMKKYNVEEEKLAKAVAISHVVNSYVKHYIGRLSALCGCAVAASTGAGVAIGWLMGANHVQIDGIVKNMIANLSGMICDGAKVGCALKLSTSASAAIQSVLLSLNNAIVPTRNGIVGETAEETIKNLGVLSEKGMKITDTVILNIMNHMGRCH